MKSENIDDVDIALGHTHAASGRREPLIGHLHDVADLASGFAESIGAEQCGRLAGLWHDLGKYSDAFQQYIRSAEGDAAHCEAKRGTIDHSTAGAQLAEKECGEVGRLLAFCIAGHHAGLPDWIDETGGKSSLQQRLEKTIEPWTHATPVDLLKKTSPSLPDFDLDSDDGKSMAFQIAVFTRFVFSCLVDADYLATERFMDQARSSNRPAPAPSMSRLLESLDTHLAKFDKKDDRVGLARQCVLTACRSAAKESPGLFSLTVPTGGGKTFSSLAFALSHAKRWGHRRVIYAIPFTSIIEQNAKVFREALAGAGSDVVLEHHSNLNPIQSPRSPYAHLAAENWDAPVIATTNVQLFESLFAARPGRCRKLHRIARSVIILDEAQALPTELLKPTLAIINELCRNYGCTIVLCTATQPAITRREEFSIGLTGVREIVGDDAAVRRLFDGMERVKVEQAGHLEDEHLAEQLARESQTLCVVNTRGHAAALCRLLDEADVEGVVHLSAQMCPAHRSNVIANIHLLLDNKQPCRVVSTQLIEAGVDLDFPVVFRAMAGLDSIAQAAGRCNREGKNDLGRVILFETDRKPALTVQQAADSAREALADDAEPLALETLHRYFSHHFWKKQNEWDKHSVMDCFKFSHGPMLQFRQAAERYKMIRSAQIPVVVPYGDKGSAIVEKLKSADDAPLTRNDYRKLQPFTVGVYEYALRGLLASGVVQICNEQICYLADAGAYNERLGLLLDVAGLNPEQLMACDPVYPTRPIYSSDFC